MTQKALAGQVGVSRQTMNAIENGRHAPTVAVAIRIADVFRVTVDQLFELDYEGKPKSREPPTRFVADRSQIAAETTIEIEGRREAAIEEPAREVTLASLRNVVG
jgi:putative transcriptional regulator